MSFQTFSPVAPSLANFGMSAQSFFTNLVPCHPKSRQSGRQNWANRSNSPRLRQIRPAVILRKNSQSNRSDRGAVTQAVLMSVYRTLRLRGHDPLHTLATALRIYLQTTHLPPLPAADSASE